MKKVQLESSLHRKGFLDGAPAHLKGVMGDIQTANDAVLLRNYGYDIARLEQAIERAQGELDNAFDDYDVAWAWSKVEEAEVNLARFEARVRLARRREQLRVATRDKQRKRREELQLEEA